jgi:hypothetical protein
MTPILVDPEIQNLIPPLKPDELAKLRESILEEGCRDPLVLWKDSGILLDGHNRYEICIGLDQPYQTVEKEFPDKNRAMLWVLRNQLGRRNLSDYQFKLMVGREYELEKKISWGGDRKSETTKGNQLGHNDLVDSQSTYERLAEEHNISPKTVQRSADLFRSHQVIQQAAPEVARKLESEEIKAPQKDVQVIGKALQQATPEQKGQIVSELKDDFKKATETAKEIAIQTKIPDPTPLPPDLKTALDKYASEIGTKPPVSPIWTNSGDHDRILMVADELYCPKCNKKARIALKWVCCSLSIEDATGLAQKAMDEHIELADEKFRARQHARGAQCQ